MPDQSHGLSGLASIISRVILGFCDIPYQSHGLSGLASIKSVVIL